MKLINFCLIFLLISTICHGEDLAGLQRLALENREIVERYRANLEKSRQDETIAWSAFYPSLDLAYSTNSLDENSLTEHKENSVAYGAVSWNIFAGFRDKYNVQSTALFRKAEEYKLQGIEQDISLRVSLGYLRVYNLLASRQVAEDSYNTLQKIHKDSENRFKVGLIKKNDLLKFKVDLDNALLNLKQAKAEVDKGLELLRRETTDDVGSDDLDFREFEQLPTIVSYEELEEKMLANRSEIQILEEVAAASEMQRKAEQAGYLPRLDLESSYRKYEDDYLSGNGDFTDEEVRTQLVLSVNLFDGFAKGARFDKARLEEKGVRYDLTELQSDLKTTLRNLVLDYKVGLENVAVAESSIEQAEENLRITQLAYQEGVDQEADLLDAISNLSRARYRYVSAKSEVFANYFRITRAVEEL